MAILLNHYARLARLDGVDARSEADAAAAMGIKPGYPAQEGAAALPAARGARRCGGRSSCSPAADLDLRGARELPDDVVMEVLVARLSRARAR